MPITEVDRTHLEQCVSLAREALQAGDYPFGSVLVDSSNTVRYTDRNRVNTKADVSWHPEFTIVMWAQTHMSAEERAASTVYTSGEHCAMCSAAHGHAGLGRIVFASSCGQLEGWLRELGAPEGRVRNVPVREVLRGIQVDGPDEGLAAEVKKLQEQRFKRDNKAG